MSHFIYCYAECHYAECHYAECHLCWMSLMLNVVMLNVVILSVVAPFLTCLVLLVLSEPVWTCPQCQKTTISFFAPKAAAKISWSVWACRVLIKASQILTNKAELTLARIYPTSSLFNALFSDLAYGRLLNLARPYPSRATDIATLKLGS
jgi:hypothetical protein